jgi:thymidylate synthase
LYAEFLRNQRAYVSWEPRKNQGGLYFGRLIGFGIDHKTGKDLGYTPSKTLAKDGNQLEHVIRQCKRSVELGRSVARMQLQATTFDPFRDLTTSGQPCFPCLQHIAFDPDVKAGTLALTAFYATQQLFVKAFGNWLGLCRLGSFVADQSGLKLTRFTCFSGIQKMDVAPKGGEFRTNLIGAARDVAGQTIDGGRMVAAHVG